MRFLRKAFSRVSELIGLHRQLGVLCDHYAENIDILKNSFLDDDFIRLGDLSSEPRPLTDLYNSKEFHIHRRMNMYLESQLAGKKLAHFRYKKCEDSHHEIYIPARVICDFLSQQVREIKEGNSYTDLRYKVDMLETGINPLRVKLANSRAQVKTKRALIKKGDYYLCDPDSKSVRPVLRVVVDNTRPKPK